MLLRRRRLHDRAPGRYTHSARQAVAAGTRTHKAVPLSLAPRTGDDPLRSAGARYDFPGATEGFAATDQCRKARYQYRRAIAAHKRWRARANIGIAGDRLAAPLSRAGA